MQNLVKVAFAVGLTFASISSAKSDGFDRGSYKDTPSANVYSSAPTSYRSEEPRRGIRRWLDDRDMALARCLKRNAERRQRGLEGRDCASLARREVLPVVRKNSVRYYREDPRPTRYAESRYDRRYRSDADERRDGRSCKAAIEVSGRERGGRSRAEQSAYNAWRTEATNRHGYRFSNLDNARGKDTDCNPVRSSFGISVYVCSVRARPCSH